MTAKEIWKVLKSYVIELAKEYDKDNVAQLSAALAYYATFSIVPALIITIAVGGFVFGEETTHQRVMSELNNWMNADALQFIDGALERASGQDDSSSFWATIISIGVLVVGGTRFFAQLQAALNRVWEVRPTRMAFWDVVRKRLLSFVIIALMGTLLLASMLASTLLTAIGTFAESLVPVNLRLLELANTVVTFAGGTGLFGALFRFFPDANVKWKDIWLGAALTSAAIIIAKYGMGVYLGRSAFASAYGAAGSMIVFLFWVYISANIILMGAEFTQVHARRQGREIEPHDKAERLWKAFGDGQTDDGLENAAKFPKDGASAAKE